MQKQLKELHPGHGGPFALCRGPSPSPELEVDRTDKALALRALTQRQALVLMAKYRTRMVRRSAERPTLIQLTFDRNVAFNF